MITRFPAHIFKAYDIRGLVAGELSEELAYRIGRAFAQYMRAHGEIKVGQQVVVGRDMRETSGPFQAEVVRGLMDEGVDVVDVGWVSTPLFNFACAHDAAHAGGIMVTASHNPAAYNGFKMTLGNGLPIGKNNGMAEIYALSCNTDEAPRSPRGSVTQKDVLPAYLQKVFSVVPKEAIRPLKVVIDGGNGMAETTFRALCRELPIAVEYLYMEPDGSFPNHEANPLKTETLRDLQARVAATGADFGFALDGDADRIGLVDETGSVVDASFVGALIGLEVLRAHPNARLLYDLRSSAIVREAWEAAGAATEMSVVGHALIKKMMKERNAAFASELSLHLYYADMYDLESSDLSFLYILQLLSRERQPLSAVLAPLRIYAHSGEINFDAADKAAALRRIEERYRPLAERTSRLDGLWYGFSWGWFSVRESNTEPVLRLNLEAKTPEMMKEKVAEVRGVIEGRA